MSKVAVISSNGHVTRLIIEELVRRRYDVTGFSHEETNASRAQTYIRKDLFDITKEDVTDFEVVVSVFGTWAPETLRLHVEVINYLSDIMANSDACFVVVGGAGSLYVGPELAVQLVDTPDFPKEYYVPAKVQTDALDVLRKRNDVKWMFISPAGDFRTGGERTGEYILGGEQLTLNSRGENIISYADYALDFASETEKGNHIQEYISLVRK